MFRRLSVTSLALLLCLAAPYLRADDDEQRPADSDVKEYVEVNTTHLPQTNSIVTKLPIALEQTPANVGVVGPELIWQQSGQVLDDALQNVSGVHVQPANGVFDFFLLRGFTSEDGALFLIDGAREPEASFYQLYNAAGIEVIKGPAGFLYGSQPLSGAVNLIRKQPLPTDLLTFQGTVGSFDRYEGQIDWNIANDSGNAAFRVNGVWLEQDTYREVGPNTQYAVNPSATFQLGERTRLNINTEFVDSERSSDTGIPIVNGMLPDVPREQSYQSPLDFSEQEIQRVQFDLDHEISDRVGFRAKAYYRSLEWKTVGTQFVGVFPADFQDPQSPLLVNRVLTALDDDQTLFGTQLELTGRWDSGNVTHNVLFGIEGAQFEDTYAIDLGLDPVIQQTYVPIALFDPVETGGPAFFTPLPGGAGDTEEQVLAAYVVDQIVFNDRFQLFLGGRFDTIEFDNDLIGDSRSADELSPMFGFVVSLAEGASLYANGGRTFALPSPRTVGPVDPQESTQYEIGVRKHFADGRYRLTLATYAIDRENLPIPDDNLITQQAGDQSSKGVEFELAIEAGRGWRTFLAYAFNDSELTDFAEIVTDPFTQTSFTVDRSGNDPAFTPEHIANLWVSKTFDSGFGLALGGRYIAEQYVDEANSYEIDDSFVVDAGLLYDFRNDLRFRLNFNNIFDEEYEGRGFGGTSVIPQPEFNASATIEARF